MAAHAGRLRGASSNAALRRVRRRSFEGLGRGGVVRERGQRLPVLDRRSRSASWRHQPGRRQRPVVGGVPMKPHSSAARPVPDRPRRDRVIGVVIGLVILVLSVVSFGTTSYTAVLEHTAGLRRARTSRSTASRSGEVTGIELADEHVVVSFVRRRGHRARLGDDRGGQGRHAARHPLPEVDPPGLGRPGRRHDPARRGPRCPTTCRTSSRAAPEPSRSSTPTLWPRR